MSGARPASSAFLFLDDALAAGPDVLCAELDGLGFGGVTPAVAYHQASDLRTRTVRSRNCAEMTSGSLV
jgi:hypothetical protein